MLRLAEHATLFLVGDYAFFAAKLYHRSMPTNDRFHRFAGAAVAIAALFSGSPWAVAVDLIGYLPNYEMNATYVNNTLPGQLAMLDEIRYFGITVNSSGSLTTTAADLNNLQAIKTKIDALPAAQRPRLGITIGGANMSSGFAAVAASSSLRTTFAQNLKSLLDQTGAVAVDLDWEHPAVGTERNTHFPDMLKRVKQEFGADRRVYATLDPTVMISTSALSGANAIDGVSLMTYDLGWWSNDPASSHTGEHSLQEYVDDAVEAWTDPAGSPNQRPWVFGSWGRNVGEEKVGVGLPFYGRGFNGSNVSLAVSYRDLVASGTTSNGSDYVHGGANLWIPSLEMVKERVTKADAEGLQHIIIWELAQDLAPNNPNSMLRTAYETKQSLEAIPGDFDGDDAVGQLDLNLWQAAFGTVGSGGDADGDNDADGADFLIWQRHATPAVPLAPLPEPAAAVLFGTAILGLLTVERGSVGRVP